LAKAFQPQTQFYTRWTAIKENYHPNSYLQHVKSMKNGLKARTKLLNVLDKRSADASAIAQETAMSYDAVMYHLRLLEAEDTVRRKGRRPFFWEMTGLGQKRLVA